MTDPDEAWLIPGGKTCGDCKHLKRCIGLHGTEATSRNCGWAPARFVAKKEPKQKAPGLRAGFVCGYLTVTRFIGSKRTNVECRCKCGTVKVFNTKDFKRYRHKSCGKCINNYSHEGERYGMLVRGDKLPGHSNGSYYRWHCDCGGTLDAGLHSIRNNKRLRSCGCTVEDGTTRDNARLMIRQNGTQLPYRPKKLAKTDISEVMMGILQRNTT